MDKIVAQIKDMKIFVRKDTDVEYDAMLYSFGCRRMHLLETANEDSVQVLHSMVVAHIRHQCTSYDRIRKRLYKLHRSCYKDFITRHLKIKVLSETAKVYPKYSSTCAAQIEWIKELLIKEYSIDA